MKKTGRKSPYNEDTFPLLAEGYARMGLSDKQIAKNLGITCSTFYDYQIKHPEFSEAIKRGKRPVDIEVENALLKRALGYTVEEETQEVRVSQDGTAVPVMVKKVTKHVPGEVGAQAFWLKNRNPSKWKDKNETDITTKGDKVMVILPSNDD